MIFILSLHSILYQYKLLWTPDFLKLNNKTKITSQVPGSHSGGGILAKLPQ